MSQKHVLLIEDEPHIAEAIRFILGRAGWLVSHEANGARALARIVEAAPDAVILDLMLPGRSGLEILTELRTDPRFADLPVLMLSARGQGRDREAAARAGATEFLSKPFANADVPAALERIIAAARGAGSAAMPPSASAATSPAAVPAAVPATLPAAGPVSGPAGLARDGIAARTAAFAAQMAGRGGR